MARSGEGAPHGGSEAIVPEIVQTEGSSNAQCPVTRTRGRSWPAHEVVRAVSRSGWLKAPQCACPAEPDEEDSVPELWHSEIVGTQTEAGDIVVTGEWA